MKKNTKIQEVNKENLLIKYDNGNHKMEYDEDLIFKSYTNFLNKKLINKNTKEKIKYKDLVLMKDSNKGIYLYPKSVEDLFEVHEMYNIDNWSFEGDANKTSETIQDLIKTVNEMKNSITELDKKTSSILGLVSLGTYQTTMRSPLNQNTNNLMNNQSINQYTNTTAANTGTYNLGGINYQNNSPINQDGFNHNNRYHNQTTQTGFYSITGTTHNPNRSW